MSAELTTPESKISFVKGRPQDRKTNQGNIFISGVDVGRKQRTPSTPASASIMGTLDAAVWNPKTEKGFYIIIIVIDIIIVTITMIVITHYSYYHDQH